MIIAAYDPGDRHTGVAIIDTDDNRIFTHQIEGYDLTELRRFNPFGLTPDVIVAEDFRLRPALAKSLAGSQLTAVRVLGALEMIASIRGCEFVLQQPSQMQAWSNARVEKWLSIKNTKALSSHTLDALRHLCVYLKKVNDDTAPLRRERFPSSLSLGKALNA